MGLHSFLSYMYVGCFVRVNMGNHGSDAYRVAEVKGKNPPLLMNLSGIFHQN